MKGLRVFVATILVPMLVLSGLLIMIDRVTTAKYITSVAERTDAYNTVAAALPMALATKSDGEDPANREQTIKTIQSVVTPEYLKEQFPKVLQQIEELFKGSGTAITIDLRKIAEAAVAQNGIPEAQEHFKNITIPTEKVQPQVNIVHNAQNSKIAIWVITALLLIASLVLAYLAGSYVAPGVALVVAGTLNVLYGVGTFLIPDKLIKGIHFDGVVASFGAIISTTVHQVSHDLGLQFGIVAAVYLVIGTFLLIFSKKLPSNQSQLTESTPATTTAS